MNKIVSILLRIITAFFLFLAIDSQPYAYYQLLRLGTFGISFYFVAVSYALNKQFWLWVFVAIAFIFNPFINIHLNKDAWQIIDIVAGSLYLLSIFFVREEK
jgi:hypothetical protein